MSTALAIRPSAKRQLSHKHLISEELWERVVRRILSENSHKKEMDRGLAEECLNEALGYLSLSAVTEECYSPAPLVDIGWHAFLQYTRQYREFCIRIAGQFIDHEPFDIPGFNYGDLTALPTRTMEAMLRHGIAVDAPHLWTGAADCCEMRYCCQNRDKCG